MSDNVTISAAPCPTCGQPASWRGSRVTPGDSTRWDIDCSNPACRPPALKETA